ncbi:hypothetical protein B0H34DRAFT_802300 [Crassisporium funariophilum]|nr:hypothetical protein B0H34DRAFT_802300 [Crassisporium funariophilum]
MEQFFLAGSDEDNKARLTIAYKGWKGIPVQHSFLSSILDILVEKASIHYSKILCLDLELKEEYYEDIKQGLNRFLSSFVKVEAVIVEAKCIPAITKTILRQLPVPSKAAEEFIPPDSLNSILPSVILFRTSEDIKASKDDYDLLRKYLLWRKEHQRKLNWVFG